MPCENIQILKFGFLILCKINCMVVIASSIESCPLDDSWINFYKTFSDKYAREYLYWKPLKWG